MPRDNARGRRFGAGSIAGGLNDPRISVQFGHPMMAWLAALARRRGQPTARVVRTAVTWYRQELELRQAVVVALASEPDPRQLSLLEDTAAQLTMPGNGQQLTELERDRETDNAAAYERESSQGAR